jgi:hypothetical protein
MNSVLERQRAAVAKQTAGKAPDRVLDKQDRMDQTYAPDARKAREVVRNAASDPVMGHNLPAIAWAIAKVTGEQKAKIDLQSAMEAFATANKEYFKAELRGNGEQLIGWMGGLNGMGVALPADAPDHKKKLRDAWDTLIQHVNHATKVGVEKRHKELPITLIADLEMDKLIMPSDFNPGAW